MVSLTTIAMCFALSALSEVPASAADGRFKSKSPTFQSEEIANGFLYKGKYAQFDANLSTFVNQEQCSIESLKQMKRAMQYRATIGHSVSGNFNNKTLFNWITTAPHTRSDQLHQGWKIIVAWNEACSSCTEEIQKLSALFSKPSKSHHNIIGLVTASTSKPTTESQHVLKQLSWPFPVAEVNRKLLPSITTASEPNAFVLYNGKIIWNHHPQFLSSSLLDEMRNWNLSAIQTVSLDLRTQLAVKQCRPITPDATSEKTTLSLIQQGLKSANQKEMDGDFEGAKQLYRQMEKQRDGHGFWKYARNKRKQLERIGEKSPKQIPITEWLSGNEKNKQIDLSQGGKLIVFWELWCPHCQRELPIIQNKWAANGVDVVGLTTLNRDQKKSEVREFLKEQSIVFPIAVHSGRINASFAVQGIPAAVYVKNGTILWLGHPAQFSLKHTKKMR